MKAHVWMNADLKKDQVLEVEGYKKKLAKYCAVRNESKMQLKDDGENDIDDD